MDDCSQKGSEILLWVFFFEGSGLLESCTYIGSQNSPHIVLLLWPKIDGVLCAPKCLFPVFGLTVLCLHNLREVEKRGGVHNLASRKLKRGFDRHAFSFFRECLKPFI